jgi:hypothetical protein
MAAVTVGKPIPWKPDDPQSADDTLLGRDVGYDIIFGFGVFFSVFTSILVGAPKLFLHPTTWTATLLQSSNVAWTCEPPYPPNSLSETVLRRRYQRSVLVRCGRVDRSFRNTRGGRAAGFKVCAG